MTGSEMQLAVYQAGVEAMRTEMVRCHETWALLLVAKAEELHPGVERTITEHMAGWHAGQAVQVKRVNIPAPRPRLAATSRRSAAG